MLLNFMYCFACFSLHIKIVLTLSLAKEFKLENHENSNFTMQESNVSIMMDEMNSGETNNNTKIRVKRQGGAGKFTDAAKMPQVKIMRLFMQLFKNFWDSSYVGGSHPLHPEIPKVIVALYKQKIVEFFVPDVGEDAEKQ